MTGGRTVPVRAILLVTALLTGLALIVTGIALWSTAWAFIAAGTGVIALAVLALVEVG